MKKEKVLITGAAGFVGANLVRRLFDENYEVHILTMETDSLWRLDDVLYNLNNHKVDILDKKRLQDIISRIKPKKICHLASYGVYPFQKDEKKIVETNLIGTMNLIECLKEIEYDCFINTGSCFEYGQKKNIMKENDSCNPTGIYGISKLASTLYCNQVANLQNKNIGTVRIFTVYGNYEEKGRLITTLFTNFINHKNVKISNPKACRDFIYIEDVVEAYIKILKNPEKIKGKIFNISSGLKENVYEVAKKVKKILNTSNEIDLSDNSIRDFDETVYIGDNTEFTRSYEWKPRTLEEGLKDTEKWFKKNLYLYSDD